jgi:hypothetical protein
MITTKKVKEFTDFLNQKRIETIKNFNQKQNISAFGEKEIDEVAKKFHDLTTTELPVDAKNLKISIEEMILTKEYKNFLGWIEINKKGLQDKNPETK